MRCVSPLKLACILVTVFLLITPFDSNASHNAPCSSCHNANNPEGAWREAMCLICHGPGGSSSLRAEAHAGLDCYDCHEPHAGSINRLGGVNRSQLRSDVDVTGQHSNSSWQRTDGPLPEIITPPENRAAVVFESRGTSEGEPTLHSFADGDEDGDGVFDGICEVCHQDYLDNVRHHIGETCTACHPHSNGFWTEGQQ